MRVLVRLSYYVELFMFLLLLLKLGILGNVL